MTPTLLPTLSILICHLPERRDKLNDLVANITRQVTGMCVHESVKVLVNAAPPPMSVGEKRNALLAKATTDYVAFVDDDDQISDYYIPRVLLALTEHPDVVGMQGYLHHTKPGRVTPELFVHSKSIVDWYEQPEPGGGKKYFRCPNHLNPVRTILAKRVGFPETSYGEDFDYSKRLLPLLKSEVYLEGPIYHYITQ